MTTSLLRGRPHIPRIRLGSLIRKLSMALAMCAFGCSAAYSDASGGYLRVQYPGPVVRCVTPAGFCFIQGMAPPGTPCWCASPYGPVQGRTG